MLTIVSFSAEKNKAMKGNGWNQLFFELRKKEDHILAYENVCFFNTCNQVIVMYRHSVAFDVTSIYLIVACVFFPKLFNLAKLSTSCQQILIAFFFNYRAFFARFRQVLSRLYYYRFCLVMTITKFDSCFYKIGFAYR